MACKYVKDFAFGTDQGFTGSAGKTMVQGYARGGNTKAPCMPATGTKPAKCGGAIKK